MNGTSLTPPRRPLDALSPSPSRATPSSAHRPAQPSQPPVASSTQPVSIESLLTAHAHSPNPHLAALQQALSERNNLSSQNAQLWKLIEKQRIAFAHTSKDIERLRAERDVYKGKLHALGENTDAVLKSSKEREKALRGSSSASGLRAGDKSSSATDQSPSHPRANVVRHQSDDSGVMSSASTSNTLSLPVERPHMISRDSHVSLPDEAKRYITTMTDSPLPSPRLPDQSRTNSPTRSMNSPSNAQELNADKSSLRKDFSDSEFLDMEDEEGSIDDSLNDRSAASASPADIEAEPGVSQGRGKPRVAAVEDFPLPPATAHSVDPSALLRQQQQAQVQAQVQGASHSQSSTATSSTATATDPSRYTDTPTTPTANSYNPHMSFMSNVSAITSVIPSQANQPAFRALPLLPHDLPRTRIQVAASSIRPNDRGKDVLSFVVYVDPGSAKEPWTIEKLYSDVLGLDQRVRARVGKNVGKKIANLPDGKLWRDHAPSKVDQRKAVLENYLQTLINLPVKNNDEVIAFLTSDILKGAHKPVSRDGYKEGYLTKRGKNFGGWKTRFFVLQGPVLEYYESRGGTHLGSIAITGAQIGRQQRPADRRDGDEENEYRHAFLIIESKKGAAAAHRHVLCAESDQDRDNWVEILVRYVSGVYSEEPLPMGHGSLTLNTPVRAPAPIRPRTPGYPPARVRNDDISIAHAVPLSQLPLDSTNVKLFQSSVQYDEPAQSLAGSPVRESPLSSSLPSSSPLDGAGGDFIAPVGPRANSELGHYPDLAQAHLDPRSAMGSGRSSASRAPQPSPDRARQRHAHRTSYHPSLEPVKSTPNSPHPPLEREREREPSPDPNQSQSTSRQPEMNSKVKISRPMNGAPIPAGYKFGAKDAPPDPAPSSERREKAKSRMFWGFGRPGGTEKQPTVMHVPRAVFGVSVEESLDVAQIASLPAIVFRCIQYLEEKHAEQEEGIYRLSGSSAVIKSLKDRFNNDEYWDPHAIAGLLKGFFRELPTSILTRDLHLRFLAVIDLVDPQDRIKELSSLISMLPLANYSLLRALTAHLILIVQNSNLNKMTMRNVGIVFSPTLGIPAGIFSLMLGEFNQVFNIDDDGEAGEPEWVANEQGDATVTKREQGSELSRRNSRQYSDAAADQLLGLSGRKLSAAEDDQSEDGEDLSVHDESGTETTDNDVTVESSNGSSPSPQWSPSSDTPSSHLRSRASNVAATRGLNIAVSKESRRHSRMMGLPVSPRPPQSPLNPHSSGSAGSPATTGSTPSISPMQTPK
ncbi:hypothetical protein HETIRDRAFT_155979 [Heterobasidion irregulare TC 32-1]|uniref:RhoGAP-domain-containing protein n=1 Tax=Heterobasidion irregulare (strain TC 32-1) TaxID=747525 RepID=W4JZD9_HETIT|nr:uncharacterized protein HETIRDRAFT_155979 [Heterobasidion irregulare TC 32-1]ETW78943.1 hypothetical protein HETIRDRAFT_155979 [Heterobasidion irregulare TC 32-1]